MKTNSNNNSTKAIFPLLGNKKGVLILYLLLITFSSFSQWSANFQGIDSLIAANPPMLYSFYNDNNNILYLGGVVFYVNTDTVNQFFSWDGYLIQKYKDGLFFGAPNSIIKYHNNIYIGGDFNEVDNVPNTEDIAMWDGTNWNSIDDGTQMIQNTVYDMEIYHDTLYVGGNNGYNIQAYDTSWIYVGEMNGNRTRSLAVFNDKIYAGGYYGFRVKTGPTTWENAHGGPTSPSVIDMEVDTFNNFLYIGGAFTMNIDSEYSKCVAMWDGFKWTSMGYVISCDIFENAMAVYHGDLYVGGCFTTLENGLVTNHIARWDGTQWHNVGAGCDYLVYALKEFRDTLIVGGQFTYVDDTIRAYGLAKWFMPDTSCNYIKPRVQCYTDTFYVNQTAQLYNNNKYADSWQWNFGDSTTDTVQNPEHIFTQAGTYSVSVTVNHNTCTKTATKNITVLLNSNINEQQQNQNGFRVYPNPTKSFLFIELKVESKKEKGKTVQIIDINGKTIKLLKINMLIRKYPLINIIFEEK